MLATALATAQQDNVGQYLYWMFLNFPPLSLQFIGVHFILPIRILFDKLNIATGIPLDIPFFVSYLLLTILSMFL